MNYISQFLSDFFSILNEMSPYLLLGFLVAGILNALIPKRMVSKYLGQNNFKSVFNASLLGVPLPLCSCGVIPTGISFYKNGASKGATNSFLISTPQTGVDSILVTYSLLGLPFAILRPLIALISGVIGGIFTNAFDKNTEAIKNQTITQDITYKTLFDKIFKYAFVDFLQDIANWLVIGLLIAAFISVAVPESFFTNYLNNKFVSMLVVLIASIPLYVCATSSVPIAAVLLMKGLSPGAALVFLMAGPATNAATITVIKNSMGKKALFSYLFSIIFSALFFGTIINEFLPTHWFAMGAIHALHSHSHEILPFWFKTLSSVLLFLFIVNAYFQKYKSRFNLNATKNQHITNIKGMEKISVIIKGMNCNHCKQNVVNAISQIADIESVEVDLTTETATISGKNVNLETIKTEIEKVGYKFMGLKE